MKSATLVLTVLGVIVNASPPVLGADPTARDANQRGAISTRTPVQSSAPRGLVSAPPPATPRQGYLTQPPPPALRFNPGYSPTAHGGTSKFAESEHRSESAVQSEPEPKPANEAPAKAKTNETAKMSDPSLRSRDLTLQRLVRYFEKSSAASTNASGSVSFNPPVSEVDLSKKPAPTGETKK